MLHRYRTGLDDRQYGSRVEAMQCPLPRNPVQGNHKSRNVNRTLFLTFLSLISAGALQAQAGGNTSSTTTPGAVLNGTATLVGHYNSDQMLRLAIALRPPHFDEEQQLIKELHDKKSPQFHKFLTADEFNARFAPSVEDEQTVVDWARSQGLTITHRYPTRMVVDVQATAGTIEKALNITINNYQLGSTSSSPATGNHCFPRTSRMSFWRFSASTAWNRSVQRRNSSRHRRVLTICPDQL